jgi:small subunit ribosomal protein S16
MLTIRLQRVGKIHSPFYRVVSAQKHRSVSKKFKEILATYDPRSKELVVKNQEKIEFYLKNNVDMSSTVKSIFTKNKLITVTK